MSYKVEVASAQDYIGSFEVTDPNVMPLFHAAMRSEKKAIDYFRDVVSKRYGATGWYSFDLTVDGQWLANVRRIPLPRG